MKSLDDIGADHASRRLTSPAAQRNREPILAVLRQALPATGRVLEVASGSGEHARDFAAALPSLRWQPTDASHEALASIAAWREQAALENLLAPMRLDVIAPWPDLDAVSAIVCINMLHISPWAASEALFANAARVLADGAPLIVYGPFRRHGAHTAPSNAQFDASLRQRDPSWGVRDLERVETLAEACGFSRQAVHALPANNFCVVWRRHGAGSAVSSASTTLNDQTIADEE